MNDLCQCCGQPGGVCRACGREHSPCVNGGCEQCHEDKDKPLDLKAVLMELGNRLVTEHGFEPNGVVWESETWNGATAALVLVTHWFNENPEAREILAELGFHWSMPEKENNV